MPKQLGRKDQVKGAAAPECGWFTPQIGAAERVPVSHLVAQVPSAESYGCGVLKKPIACDVIRPAV